MDPLYLRKCNSVEFDRDKNIFEDSRFLQPISDECENLHVASVRIVKTRCVHKHKSVAKFYMVQNSYGMNVPCKRS